ncbi:MAG: PucR family transcriptional regulator [Nocardioides sp.]|uniref:PucR family transcriptional regulator n=1 Tax=Nocardioides sp. TaxID=35761 RepID=UPI0039E2AC2A
MVIRLPTYGRARTELPSVADVLDYPALRRGDPVVVAGASGLRRPVRWVHVSEVLGIADLLRGDELLLTTGMILPEDPAGITGYVERLADANVAALVIGLGPRFAEPLPEAMIAAADRRGLPLIALRRTIAFIDVTEEVHATLVDVQVRELQASENIHRIFSSLAVQGSTPERVLSHVAKLSGFAVVLENRDHRLLAFDPAKRSRGDVLEEWAEYTQVPVRRTRTYYDPQTGWLRTTVGARGDDWGQLILMAGDAGERDVSGSVDATTTVPRSLIMLVEQAASTLAINRLVDRESELLELNTHQSLLRRLLAGPNDAAGLEQHAAALGVSLRRCALTAIAVRSRRGGEGIVRRRDELHSLATTIAEVARREHLPALIAPLDEDTVGGLVDLTGAARAAGSETSASIDRISGLLAQQGLDVVLAHAGPASGLDAARQNLAEAIETVAAAIGVGMDSAVLGWDDLGIRGVVYALRDDPRLARFADRLLAPLLRHDREHDTTLVDLLRHYLDAGRNKTVAAQRAYVSRPWMHERLRLISSLLEIDLEDEEQCMNLQIALVIADTADRTQRPH